MLRKWDELPEDMKTEEVREYYEILSHKQVSLFMKRVFDIIVAMILLILLAPIMLVISLMIIIDSPGGVFYRQVRITQYGKEFRIHKFRTMVSNADKIGSQVTVGQDVRITKTGKFLRKYRLDEFPQLIDILQGNMSFVGTRPEVPKYVKEYSKEMKATLLLPAGITSEASICYKDEAELLEGADDVDAVYVEQVLPGKMEYNFLAIKKFTFFSEIETMFRTVFAVLGKDYSDKI